MSASIDHFMAADAAGEGEHMSFWKRLTNLWKGFLSLWISNIEQEHPEIAYENSINAMVEKYTDLKKAAAALLRRRDDIALRLKKQSADLERVNVELEAAVAGDHDGIALHLITAKGALDADVAELHAELEAAHGEADEAKKTLISVQTEVQQLKAEKDRMIAKMASAQARLAIQQQLEGLSMDAEVKALAGVRDHINEAVAQTKLNAELQGSSLDHQLAELRAQHVNATARQQLDALKAAHRAQQPATEADPARTM
ncbi:MAG: PspA/IM30 family protein [Candidatus Uhrbacteria bacterium]